MGAIMIFQGIKSAEKMKLRAELYLCVRQYNKLTTKHYKDQIKINKAILASKAAFLVDLIPKAAAVRKAIIYGLKFKQEVNFKVYQKNILKDSYCSKISKAQILLHYPFQNKGLVLIRKADLLQIRKNKWNINLRSKNISVLGSYLRGSWTIYLFSQRFKKPKKELLMILNKGLNKMRITKEIESIHQENLKSLRTKWCALLIISQLIWLLLFIFFNSQSPSLPVKALAVLPTLQKNYIRLELPLNLYFPVNASKKKILIHHQQKNTILTNAILYRKSSRKDKHYIVDIPKTDLKKLLPLPEYPLEAYPDKEGKKKHLKRRSYEIVY